MKCHCLPALRAGLLPTVEENQSYTTYKVPMSMHRISREKVCRRLVENGAEASGIVLLKGGESPYRHDTDHEDVFRQESSFHYLFGVNLPDCSGIIHIDSHKCVLFVPRLPASYAVWFGAIHSLQQFKDQYEVDECHYTDELDQYMSDLGTVSNPRIVYVNKGKNTDSKSESRPASIPSSPHLSLNDSTTLFNSIAECRMIKTQDEINLLQYSCLVSSESHLQVMRRCTPGMMEYQLESMFLHYCYFKGGLRLAGYTCISCSGFNSATLHYGHAGAPNDKLIGENEMMLIDMGGEFHCYGADITNSFPSNGHFTPQQRIMFETVRCAQSAIMDILGPSIYWRDMQDVAYRVICTKLKEFGLLIGDVDEMVAANVGGIFMPHGLGHFLGIDTHDSGGIPEGAVRDERVGHSSLRCLRVLEAGMVITVEPGLYFVDCQLDLALSDPTLSKFFVADVVNSYRGLGGVRLEDDVVITQTGFKCLSFGPRTIEDVEAVMDGRITMVSQLQRHPRCDS